VWQLPDLPSWWQHGCSRWSSVLAVNDSPAPVRPSACAPSAAAPPSLLLEGLEWSVTQPVAEAAVVGDPGGEAGGAIDLTQCDGEEPRSSQAGAYGLQGGAGARPLSAEELRGAAFTVRWCTAAREAASLGSMLVRQEKFRPGCPLTGRLWVRRPGTQGPRMILLLPLDEFGALGHAAITLEPPPPPERPSACQAPARGGPGVAKGRGRARAHAAPAASTAGGGGCVSVGEVLEAVRRFYDQELSGQELAAALAAHPALRRRAQVRARGLGCELACASRLCSRLPKCVGEAPVWLL
jgi:hypothetical protein